MTTNATATAPAATDATATLNAGELSMAAWCLKDLTAAYTRHIKWQAACRAYSRALAAGQNPDAPKGLPSKAAKHQMYGDAARLMSILKLEGERPHTLAEIGVLISVALDIL